jgi:hypothetical protein
MRLTNFSAGVRYVLKSALAKIQTRNQREARMQNAEINRNTMNKDYDLISVLYHALQAADTSAQYSKDAQTEGSQEVSQFMKNVEEQNRRIAEQAKELLLKQKQV